MANNKKTYSESEKAQDNMPKINEYLAFPVIALALLMMTIDSTIVATALHSIQQNLNTSVSWAGWTMTAYSFGFVLMLPLSARLSIRYGNRRVYLASVATFTVASLLCGLSNNIYMLIAMRTVQAIGGSGITPSATGIIVNSFTRSREQFLGLFGSIFAIGGMIGPVFGGIFVTYLNWQWIFFINIPFGLAILILSSRFIPRSTQKLSSSEKNDYRGMMLLAVALLAAMFSATYLGENISENSVLIFTFLILISASAFFLFFHHLKKAKSPFINPVFIYGKGFGAVNLLNLIHAGMVMGTVSLIPFYAVNRYGISELHSGTLLIAEGIAAVVMSVVMSILIRKTGYRMPLYAGSIILAAGIVLFSVKPMFGLSPYAWLSISSFLTGFGMGVMSPAARNAGIHLAPRQSANLAAIRSLGLQSGQIFSIAIATAIIAGSANPSVAHGKIYLWLTIILLITIPVISQIPENKSDW